MTEIITGANYDNRIAGETRKGNWMQTYAGRHFYPLDPRADEMFIDDIAHSLSLSGRFAGHCLNFYSVAEHCVHASHIVPPEHALTALMHDATEAYLVDVPRPIKSSLSGYMEIEDELWRVMAEKYGLPRALPDEVKIADNAMLLAEREQNMAPTDRDWRIPGEPAKVTLQFWSPKEAEEAFLARFAELTA
jgi:hypothetical protein